MLITVLSVRLYSLCKDEECDLVQGTTAHAWWLCYCYNTQNCIWNIDIGERNKTRKNSIEAHVSMVYLVIYLKCPIPDNDEEAWAVVHRGNVAQFIPHYK
jgi:hypothetical protein